MLDSTTVDPAVQPLRILILSPQPWLGLQVSKHHYAREAATHGHSVIFANPPGGSRKIVLTPSGVDNLTLLDHPAMPLRRAKFHARWLFDLVARARARAIVAVTGPIDLLWDFDNAGQFADHRAFKARRGILHVMDRLDEGARHSRHADMILGVAPSLIADLSPPDIPRHTVQHGLAPLFADLGESRLASATPSRTQPNGPLVGFLGNLGQPWMDRSRLLQLIKKNPSLVFRFIGPAQGASTEAERWIEQLRVLPNVQLAGLKTGSELVAAMREIDIWLLCYDRNLDPNRGVNSHKLLEYFATGAEVVSSHIAAQANAPGVFMAPADAPEHIDGLLQDAVSAVREGRDTGWRQRVKLALANGYAANFRQIAGHLSAIDDPN